MLPTLATRRVARISQKGGGVAFFEVWSNRKQTWPKFSLVLNWIEAMFQWKLGDLPKKKGLHRSSNAEIRNSRPKTGDLKKKVFTDFGQAPEPNNSTILVQMTACPSQLWLPNPFGGGLFSILEQKSASKALKTCYFAYFSGQFRPPLTSLLLATALSLLIDTEMELINSFS